MKAHTNLYGMSSLRVWALIAQNDVTKLAKQLGFNELSFYFIDICSDSQSELECRLDGIMASVGYGDVVIYQSPTLEWSGVDSGLYQQAQDLQAKLITFIHDVPPLMFPSNYYLMPEYRYVQSVRCGRRSFWGRCGQASSRGLTVNKILIQRMWDHPYDLPLHQPQFVPKLYFAGSVERFPHLINWSYATPLEIFFAWGRVKSRGQCQLLWLGLAGQSWCSWSCPRAV